MPRPLTFAFICIAAVTMPGKVFAHVDSLLQKCDVFVSGYILTNTPELYNESPGYHYHCTFIVMDVCNQGLKEYSSFHNLQPHDTLYNISYTMRDEWEHLNDSDSYIFPLLFDDSLNSWKLYDPYFHSGRFTYGWHFEDYCSCYLGYGRDESVSQFVLLYMENGTERRTEYRPDSSIASVHTLYWVGRKMYVDYRYYDTSGTLLDHDMQIHLLTSYRSKTIYRTYREDGVNSSYKRVYRHIRWKSIRRKTFHPFRRYACQLW